METTSPCALDYFAGGVPSSEFFRGTLEDIREISTENANKAINRIQELCFIGALSYFEHAFRTLFSGSMRGFQSAL